MIRNLCTISLVALLFSGCVTTPLSPVDIAVNPPDSITIDGGGTLPERTIHIEDGDEVRKIIKLINRIRGSKRSQLNFEPGEIQLLSIKLHQGDKSTELTMGAGRMLDPSVGYSLFYESENNDELWDLMTSYLDSAE